MVLASSRGMFPTTVEWTFFMVNSLVSSGREAIHLGDFELLRYFGAQVKRVSIVIRIWILEQPQIEPALRVGSVAAATPSDFNQPLKPVETYHSSHP